MTKLTETQVLAELGALLHGLREDQRITEELVIEARKLLDTIKGRGTTDKHLVSLLEVLFKLSAGRENLFARAFSSPSFLIAEEGLHRINTLVQAGSTLDDAIGQTMVDMNLADPGEGLNLPTLDEVDGLGGKLPEVNLENLPGGDSGQDRQHAYTGANSEGA